MNFISIKVILNSFHLRVDLPVNLDQVLKEVKLESHQKAVAENILIHVKSKDENGNAKVILIAMAITKAKTVYLIPREQMDTMDKHFQTMLLQ